MTEQNKKLSRREALKVLGAAAGATVLANLPSKWSKPELAVGALPAHAQTSSTLPTVTSDSLTDDSPTTDTMSFAGTVIADGGSPIIARGFVWCLNADRPPTIGAAGSTAVPDGSPAVGTFSALGVTLPSAETIYMRAYATNSVGTGYGVELNAYNDTPTLPTVSSVRFTDTDGASTLMDFSGRVVSDGGAPVTARGFVYCLDANRPPTLGAAGSTDVPSGSGTGMFTSFSVDVGAGDVTFYMRPYATNSVGTAYGIELNAYNYICLAEGTQVTLANGSLKKIEDIKYTDLLSVWNFDDGQFDTAHPLWIKKTEQAHQYNLLVFSDGSTLKTINQHRIFNKELGIFTYPMTEDTPLGTTTFNVKGEEVKLVEKSIVHEPVNYYNVITFRHMNLFADGILTSCRYNNIYPISDMKFVKDNRKPIPQSEYGVDDKYYEGLRLAEQSLSIEETLAYISRLKAHELEAEPMFA